MMPQPPLTPMFPFSCVWYHARIIPMYLIPSSLDDGYTSVAVREQRQEQRGYFA